MSIQYEFIFNTTWLLLRRLKVCTEWETTETDSLQIAPSRVVVPEKNGRHTKREREREKERERKQVLSRHTKLRKTTLSANNA